MNEELKEGNKEELQMGSQPFEDTPIYKFIREEFELMRQKPEQYDVILPYEGGFLEIARIASEQGYSGAAAGLAIPVVCNTLKRVLLFHTSVPIIPSEEEYWVEAWPPNHYQHKRCGGLFKEDGEIHYIDGILFRTVISNGEKTEGNNYWHSSCIALDKESLATLGESPEGFFKEIESHLPVNINGFVVVDPNKPFTLKQFIVDIIEWEVNKETKEPEVGTGWWESKILDATQLKEVLKEYTIKWREAD
jgi:hypothetical protein